MFGNKLSIFNLIPESLALDPPPLPNVDMGSGCRPSTDGRVSVNKAMEA